MRINPRAGASLRPCATGRVLFPSVTEVLKVIQKPYLDNWRHRVGREDADKVLRSAAEFGTKLHGAAQKVAWREPVEAEIEPYAAAVRAFLDKHVLEILGTEVELVNPNLRFGGTLDL